MIKRCDSFVDILPATNSEDSLVAEIQNNEAICTALKRLREANDSANACERDPWDFAVELSQFSDCGIGTHVLRMMICRNWITHMREVTSSSKHRREFEPESDLVLSPNSCFLLTKKGFEIASKLTQWKEISMTQNDATTENRGEEEARRTEVGDSTENPMCAYPTPRWDRKRRELRIGGVLVKRFKWPAENQEQVLDAFEEEGWPPRIDDPLIPHPKIDPKRRLHDTLKCLNRKQINGYIKFRGDGTGQGVLLEINWDGRK